MLLLKAALLGLVEGITEFLPISSTGHLIVASDLLDYPARSRGVFDIFIQLGAILAVVWHYRSELTRLVRQAPAEAGARALLGQIAAAFVPAAACGYLFHRQIETHLFSSVFVGLTLVGGGLLLVAIERRTWHFDVERLADVGWGQALAIGAAQVLSLLPGVSRAGATIIGGMFAGLNRPAATQFSFYLSIPTLCAASLYSLWSARALLSAADIAPLAIGFVTSFVSALVVVRAFISFVQGHTFTGFGYYRIAIGIVILCWFR
jgi:undecaprenyl-diphosphatase